MPGSESRDHIQGPVNASITLVETEIMNVHIAARPI
jgi:hypothetical protein